MVWCGADDDDDGGGDGGRLLVHTVGCLQRLKQDDNAGYNVRINQDVSARPPADTGRDYEPRS